MKKFLTLALVLVLALGVAAPAFAYTTNVAPAQGVSPYTVDMYLVEYISGDILGGWITMPPSDRGYAKNEVVAGVGVLNVPANYDVYADAYTAVKFKGKNVTLNVQANKNTFDAFTLRNSMPTASNWLEAFHTKATSTVLVGGVEFGLNTVSAPNSAVNTSIGATSWFINGDDNVLAHPIWPLNNTFAVANVYAAGSNIVPNASSDKTYRFLIFAKVTDDEAKLTFSLSRNETWVTSAALLAAPWNQIYVATPANAGIFPQDADNYTLGVPIASHVLVLNEDLVVYRENGNSLGPNRYYVFETDAVKGLGFTWDLTPAGYVVMNRTLDDVPGDLLASFEVKARGVSNRMWIYPRSFDSTGYRVHVEPSTNELVFIISQFPGAGQKVNDQIRFGTAGYSSLLNFYTDIVETKLGFSAFNEGNLLKGGDWVDLAAAFWDVSETVNIEPWTPYVAVPENIVTDPPKTGDASILGFVMIALAGAAAVVVKKVRA